MSNATLAIALNAIIQTPSLGHESVPWVYSTNFIRPLLPDYYHFVDR